MDIDDGFKVVEIQEENFNLGKPRRNTGARERFVHFYVKDKMHRIVSGSGDKFINLSPLKEIFNTIKSFIPDLTMNTKEIVDFEFESKTYDLRIFFQPDLNVSGAIDSNILDKDKIYQLLEIVDNIFANFLSSSSSKKRRLSYEDNNSRKKSKVGSGRRKKTTRRRHRNMRKH